jgi:hypothetical protein
VPPSLSRLVEELRQGSLQDSGGVEASSCGGGIGDTMPNSSTDSSSATTILN